jgi:FKBP-type peptidyl-prolyl cis-trans isomerase FkpA
MKIQSLNFLTIALTAGVLLSSCKTTPYEGYDVTDSGLYYKFINEGKGTKPQVGDNVKVMMIYKTEKDSTIFNSKELSRDGSGAIEFPLQESTFKGSFEEALLMMSEGDSASFKINADSIYSKTFRAKALPPYIKPGSMLTFEAKLVQIKPKAEVEKERAKQMEEQQVMMEKRKTEEPASIAKYVADNKITVKPTDKGLYYIELVKGKGKKVASGDTVEVQYKGMFLDGKVFDSSEGSPVPVKFPIGVGAVIPGWDQALTMMNVGGKAKVIIPSELAYGANGAQGVIPPYTPLVFEVEVVNSITPKK